MSIRKSIFSLVFISFFSFFIHLGALPVDNIMEARNFVTAREIVQNGTWLVPTMNGDLRLEKPPLPTWVTAGLVMLNHGFDSLTLVRLPSALLGLIMTLSVFFLLLIITNRIQFAFFSAAIFATLPQTIELSRQNFWDIYTHSFMLLAITLFLIGIRHRRKWLFLIGSSITLGLSILSKGPVSLMMCLVPFLVAYCLCLQGTVQLRRSWKEGLFVLGTGLIIGFSWPLAVFLSSISSEGVAVLQKEVGGWSNRQVQPFWFYAHFQLLTGFWLVSGVAVVFYRYMKQRVYSISFYQFALLWSGIVLLILMIMPHKNMRYLFPLWIPYSMLIGSLWTSWVSLFQSKMDRISDRVLISMHGTILILLCAGLSWFIYTQYGLSVSIFMLLFWIGVIIYIQRKRNVYFLFLSTIGIVLTLLCLVFPLYAQMQHEASRYTYFDAFQTDPDLASYPLYTTEPALHMGYVYYAGREILEWDDSLLNDKSQPHAVLTYKSGYKDIEPYKIVPVSKNNKKYWAVSLLP